MTLREWLFESGTKQYRLAETLGISKQGVNNLVNGRHGPTLDLALRIERATGGMVKAETWVRAKARRERGASSTRG